MAWCEQSSGFSSTNQKYDNYFILTKSFRRGVLDRMPYFFFYYLNDWIYFGVSAAAMGVSEGSTKTDIQILKIF